ncbi:MAG: sigma-70 family RNA polymerase sigma factor [Planctomycetes bacterium]|nr:sigma-70 family RNA polymerase sigma factor [Planctomycetota bacterium]
MTEDTTAGGVARQFPSTHWSLLLDARTTDVAKRRRVAETLAGSYWKPIYTYIRVRWAKSNEDAKDLTQGFFLWMIESDLLSRADPRRGRLRGLLKSALDHYLSNDERRQATLKRGGEQPVLRLGDSFEVPDPAGRAPDAVLVESWKSEMLARALALLEQGYRREGKVVHFEVFRSYYMSDPGEINYKEVAERYRITSVDVSNYLMDAKRRFRAVLTDVVAETVRTEQDLADEMKDLFGESPP